MNKNKQILPKWFTGELYNSGDNIKNMFSGNNYHLNSEELSMYDFIKGCEYTLDVRGFDKDIAIVMQKGLSWFRKNNNKAYMVLLD